MTDADTLLNVNFAREIERGFEDRPDAVAVAGMCEACRTTGSRSVARLTTLSDRTFTN